MQQQICKTEQIWESMSETLIFEIKVGVKWSIGTDTPWSGAESQQGCPEMWFLKTTTTQESYNLIYDFYQTHSMKTYLEL